ncbi:MAG: gluconeogenesis factor YvcK family protein [Patescibacteria group bacterium]
MKNVVVIGGGTGTFTVLSGLKKYPVKLKAIVSMADSGGSTGRLRDELGVLPPGDVRQCLVALSQAPRLRDLFNYRFRSGSLSGHNFGNLFLAALEKLTGNFQQAVLEASKILNIKGEVIAVTTDKVNLCAKLEDGKVIFGESNIDRAFGFSGKLKIKKAYLKPQGKITLKARKAIITANAIILGPGDLYTSIIPNLLVAGVCNAIKKSKAKKIYICNLMTKFGETHGFNVSNYVLTLEKYLGKNVLNFVLYNTKKPAKPILDHYKKEKEFFVEIDPENFPSNIKFIGKNFLNKEIVQRCQGVSVSHLVRHNPDKLAETILKIIKKYP